VDLRLRDQRRYLTALDAAAAAQPDAQANQLAALARERALAAATDDAMACRIASGDLFELARGGWLDRLLGHARIAAALDDPFTAQAMAVEVEATLAARGHREWVSTLQAGSTRAAVWHERAGQAKSSAVALIGAAITGAWDQRPAAQAEARAVATAAWQQWSALEPLVAGGDAAAFARALAQPRYRQRVPWTGVGVAALVERMASFGLGVGAALDVEVASASAIVAGIEDACARWRAGLATATPSPIIDGEPELADVIAPYASLTGLPGTEPTTIALVRAARRLVAHAGGAETPQGVLAAWTEADLLADFAAAPVRANAEAALVRAEAWPDPILQAGARGLLAELSEIRTGCEVDLISVHHDACAVVEADWNYGLGAVMLAPVEATAIAGWDPSAAPSIATAWRLLGALTGVGAELLTIPRVDAVLALVATRDQRPADLGAWRGEIGHRTVGEAKAWFGVRGLDPRTASAVGAALTAAWGAPAAGAARPVRLWDHQLALDELDAPPPRPPTPGRSRPARP